MAVFFLVTTVSYSAARVFVSSARALACFFYVILRLGQVPRTIAIGLAAVALHARDRPLVAVGDVGDTLCGGHHGSTANRFLSWFWNNRPVYCWLAFGLSGLAFLCRVTTAGVLPGWLLFVVLMGCGRRLASWHVVLPAWLYLGF